MRRNYYPNFFKAFIHTYPLKVWRTCLDFLFPRHCLGCGKTGVWLCQNCLARLPLSYSPREDKIFSVFEYGSPVVKQVIWHLKYKRGLELAEILAKPLCDTLFEELEDELIISPTGEFSPAQTSSKPEVWAGNVRSETSHKKTTKKIILIPAPLSPARYRSRGYNQAHELARQMTKLNPEQFEIRADLVKKVKNTPSQVSIKNRADRLANLKNAFVLQDLRYPISQNKGIFVIIDDVSTTGATINEIRDLLVKNNLASRSRTFGLVVAHG